MPFGAICAATPVDELLMFKIPPVPSRFIVPSIVVTAEEGNVKVPEEETLSRL